MKLFLTTIAIVATLIGVSVMWHFQLSEDITETSLQPCVLKDTFDTERYLLEQFIAPLEASPECSKTLLLKQIFERATTEAHSPEEAVYKWVLYLQQEFRHPKLPPIHTNGMLITDPVILFSLKLGQCGQVNRLLVDGLEQAGIPARLVQLNGHVAAEAIVDGVWIYLDADALSDTPFVSNENRQPASIRDIISNPQLIESIDAFSKVLKAHHAEEILHSLFPETDRNSAFKSYFQRQQQGDLSVPYLISKKATREQVENEYFGWNYYTIDNMTYEAHSSHAWTADWVLKKIKGLVSRF